MNTNCVVVWWHHERAKTHSTIFWKAWRCMNLTRFTFTWRKIENLLFVQHTQEVWKQASHWLYIVSLQPIKANENPFWWNQFILSLSSLHGEYKLSSVSLWPPHPPNKHTPSPPSSLPSPHACLCSVHQYACCFKCGCVVMADGWYGYGSDVWCSKTFLKH